MVPTTPEATPKRLRLLDVDEELARTIPPEDEATAGAALTANAIRIDTGPAPELQRYDQSDCSGLLVVEGFLTRDVAFAEQPSRELLGVGDVLRPWDIERDYLAPFSVAGFTIMEPTLLAHLDQRLLRLGARWPRFVDELIGRMLHRARWLAIRLAINQVTRVDERLMLFFWHAAGRWGKVTPRGVVLPFGLTHEVLGELIGAQRPSVTTALNDLRRAGRLSFKRRDFVLTEEPPEGMARPAKLGAADAAAGLNSPR